jgi:ankyrin repeat protein
LQAAEKGDLKSIQDLLDTGAQLEATTQCQWTALHHATRKNHLDVVQFLVKRGINVEAKDWEGKTALDTATKFG